MLAVWLWGGLFLYHGAWIHTLLAWITAGVLFPFFYYNVFGVSKRRRRIFMGDTGSMTLGYTVVFLAISYSMNLTEIKPFSEGAIVVAFSTLLVPIFDVAQVIVVRFYNGKPLFKADRSHISGYADKGTGSPATNERLSKARAEAIYNVLVNEFGVPASQLTTSHYGGVDNMYYDDPRLSRAVIVLGN